MEKSRNLHRESTPKLEHNWSGFAEDTKEFPPSSLIVKAVKLVGHKGIALDLGPGAFRDSKYLLQEGFEKVVAVDINTSAKDRAVDIADEKLEVVVSPFETFNFPAASFDIINAQNSLPFTHPDSFNAVFEGLKSSLREGGIFTGTLFGNNDEWNGQPDMTFHTAEEVHALLSGLEVIELNDTEKEGITMAGKMKHWHIFQVTARKPPADGILFT
jgi:tellurite methyltransferase